MKAWSFRPASAWNTAWNDGATGRMIKGTQCRVPQKADKPLGCIEGAVATSIFNPQAAACTSPRSNRRLLPLSIYDRKMSVIGPVRGRECHFTENGCLHRKPALADFRWQSIDFVDALRDAMPRPFFVCKHPVPVLPAAKGMPPGPAGYGNRPRAAPAVRRRKAKTPRA